MAGYILKTAAVLMLLTVLPATPALAQLVDSFISKDLSARLAISHVDDECRAHDAELFFSDNFQREHGEKKISSSGGFIFIFVGNRCTDTQEILISQGFSLSGDEFTLNKHRATLNTTLTLSNIAGCRFCSGVPINVVVDIELLPTGSFSSRGRRITRIVGSGFVSTEEVHGFNVGAIASGSLIAGGIDFFDFVGSSSGFGFSDASISQGRTHTIIKTDR